MLRLKTTNEVIARVRAGRVELVDDSGQIRHINELELAGLETYETHRSVIPNVVEFSHRPRQFLTELRERREQVKRDAKQYNKSVKAQERAAAKHATGSGANTLRATRSRHKFVSPDTAAKLAKMDPNMLAILREVSKRKG